MGLETGDQGAHDEAPPLREECKELAILYLCGLEPGDQGAHVGARCAKNARRLRFSPLEVCRVFRRSGPFYTHWGPWKRTSFTIGLVVEKPRQIAGNGH